MTRAEEAALKAYPPTYTTVKKHAKRVQSERTDTHQPARAIFQQGYEQAEKDLALTKDDAWCIFNLIRELQTKYSATEGCLQEVADIFNEQRKK